MQADAGHLCEVVVERHDPGDAMALHDGHVG